MRSARGRQADRTARVVTATRRARACGSTAGGAAARGSGRGPGAPIAAALLLCSAPIVAQEDDLGFETVVSGLSSPVYVTHAGDARLFVVERDGLVRIVRDGSVDPQPFLDIRSRVLAGGEQGMLSIAFHPGYPDPGFVFVYYTRGDGAVVISRFARSADADRLDPGSEAVLLVVPQPFANHNGGQLQFGPDGMLYAGLGDGGSANDPQCFAQRTDSLLGKMLRLDVDRNVGAPPYYAVPDDNPYAAPGGPPGEIWASGLRNPWRFSFDRLTGDLWIGDVGQGEVEEIDREPAGAPGGSNWGWKYFEGDVCRGAGSECPAGGTFGSGCDDPSLSPPVITYRHGGGNCSVTGGYRYRGSALPEVAGNYFYGDYCSGRVWRAFPSASGWVSVELPERVPLLSSFGEDRDGELYLVALGGRLLRLGRATGGAEAGLVRWTQSAISVPETAGEILVSVERIEGGAGAVAARLFVAGGDATPGEDFALVDRRLEWADGEEGSRSARLRILDDGLAEPDETLLLGLLVLEGDAVVGTPAELAITILDDERRISPCVSGEGALCLNGGRFRVAVTWGDFEDRAGFGRAAPLTGDSGTFWFFDPDNVEVVVKVLDACAISDRYWVFATGLTNVETRVEVVDTARGELVVYENGLGEAFAPVLDTAAFATCP